MTETLEDRQLVEGDKVSGVCEIFPCACFPVSCCVTLNKLQHLSECPHLLTTECRSYSPPCKRCYQDQRKKCIRSANATLSSYSIINYWKAKFLYSQLPFRPC